MFNTYINQKMPSNLSADVTVHEHKAPTDESVRLLDEMYQKVLTKIKSNVILKNNVIDFNIIILEAGIGMPNMAVTDLDKTKLLYKFKLNGKEYEGSFYLDAEDENAIGHLGPKFNIPKEAAQKLLNHLAFEIGKVLLQDFSNSLSK